MFGVIGRIVNGSVAGRSLRSGTVRPTFQLNSFSSAASTGNSSSTAGSTVVQGPSLLTSTGVHRPNPSLFQLPGLRSLPFWTKDNVVAYKDPTVSKIIQHVESNADAIAQEYLAAVMGVNRKNANEILEPDYDLGGSKGNEHGDALHEGQWDWHSYILKGVKQPKFEDVCPVTSACLKSFGSNLFSSTPFSFAFFSTLQPGASIKAHSGPMNLRLRVHLPLIIPTSGDCGIRCGGQERRWTQGKVLVLDDSYVHEVWNRSSEPRVILLFDIWHPDVHPTERENINEMFGFAKDQGWLN